MEYVKNTREIWDGANGPVEHFILKYATKLKIIFLSYSFPMVMHIVFFSVLSACSTLHLCQNMEYMVKICIVHSCFRAAI